MESDLSHGRIEVWRPDDLPELELQRGFAVDRPVPRHWHEEYQLCLIESGAGDLMYRGTSFPTPPASLFVVPPGEIHSNRTYDKCFCSFRTIFVDADSMRRAATDVHGKERGLPFFPTTVVFDPDVLGRYRVLHVALERPSSSLARQALLLDFLAALIARHAEDRPSSSRSFGPERRAVSRACDYMTEHYAENVTLGDLARIANLSPFHFNRVFSKQFGMPPHAFQTQLRVTRAKALLRQGWPIPQVASQTGFADQSHLTRHFKRVIGVPPGQYRARSKNVQDASKSPC